MDNMTEPITAAITTGTILKHGLLACFGAVAAALRAHRMGTSKGFLDFVVLTIMSSFSGVIFALIALQVFHSEYMTLAAAGAGGFLGVEGLTVLAVKIRDSLANIIK